MSEPTLEVIRAWGCDSETHQGPDTVVAIMKVTPSTNVASGGDDFTTALVNTALESAGYSGDVSSIDDVLFGHAQDKAIYGVYDEAADKVIYYGRADDAEDNGAGLEGGIMTAVVIATRA